jgi:hypothetical protein
VGVLVEWPRAAGGDFGGRSVEGCGSDLMEKIGIITEAKRRELERDFFWSRVRGYSAAHIVCGMWWPLALLRALWEAKQAPSPLIYKPIERKVER